METADKDTQQLRGTDEPASSVHKVRENSSSTRKKCYRCTGKKNHNANDCHFKNSKCHNCGKVGHIKKACRAKVQTQPVANKANTSDKQKLNEHTRYVEAEEPELEMFSVYNVAGKSKQAFTANFTVDKKTVNMEIDTGAAVSIISQELYDASFSHLPLEGAKVKLKTYTGENIPVLGQFTARVAYDDQKVTLPLIVVQGAGPPLCGRNWLQTIRLDWKRIRRESKC